MLCPAIERSSTSLVCTKKELMFSRLANILFSVDISYILPNPPSSARADIVCISLLFGPPKSVTSVFIVLTVPVVPPAVADKSFNKVPTVFSPL